MEKFFLLSFHTDLNFDASPDTKPSSKGTNLSYESIKVEASGFDNFSSSLILYDNLLDTTKLSTERQFAKSRKRHPSSQELVTSRLVPFAG